MRPLLASPLLLGRRCSLLVRHVMRHAPCMQARLRALLPGEGRGARPLPSSGRGELCASTACGQAASIGQKTTRNSAEQIEKERLLGHKRGVIGDTIGADPPHVGDRVLDPGGGEPGIDGVPCSSGSCKCTGCALLLTGATRWVRRPRSISAGPGGVRSDIKERAERGQPTSLRGRRGCILTWQ
jgi:hypothetical protein